MLGRLFINKKRIEIKTVNTDYPLIMLYADAGRKRIGTLKAVIIEDSCALGDIDIPLDYVNLSVKPDNFYDLTKRYLKRLYEEMGFDFSKKIILLDQAFSGNDPHRGGK